MTVSNNIQSMLRDVNYVADENLSMALQLSIDLGRPLLLEGEAGVGKTEIANALAQVLETNLIRLQCYEGLDAASAIYEWNYQKQLLFIKASEGLQKSAKEIEIEIFTTDFLLQRPLLKAIQQPSAPVLLIDEIDRADEEFEAFLLEILSDFQITVPELGTLTATTIPQVILTSNGTRELSDALRRRCLYTYVDFPSPAQELDVILIRLPHIEDGFATQISEFVHNLRREDLQKKPGIAETLDWAAALVGMEIQGLDGDLATIQSTLICLLKTEMDLKSITPDVTRRLIGQVA